MTESKVDTIIVDLVSIREDLNVVRESSESELSASSDEEYTYEEQLAKALTIFNKNFQRKNKKKKRAEKQAQKKEDKKKKKLGRIL